LGWTVLVLAQVLVQVLVQVLAQVLVLLRALGVCIHNHPYLFCILCNLRQGSVGLPQSILLVFDQALLLLENGYH
jgi:hypothetical protein